MTLIPEPSNYRRASLYAPFKQQAVALLPEEKVSEIVQAFQEKVEPLNYNSLSPLLELCGWIREQGADHSWKSLLDGLPLPAERLLQKYRGGTSALVAIAAQEMLQRMGYHGDVMGQSRMVPQSYFYPEPSSYKPRVWEAARDYLQGYSHLICVLPYRDLNQQEQGLVFRHSFTQQEAPIVYPSWALLEQDFRLSSTQPMSSFTQPVSYIKANLNVHLILHALCKEKKEKCTLNLLEGTLSIEPGQLSHLPKNLDQKACFKIINLIAMPHEKTRVFIDGIGSSMTNTEVLNAFLNAIQEGFGFPEDFRENFIFLMTHQDRFFSEIALPPAATLRSLWPQYQHVDLLRRQAHFIASDSLQERESSLAKHLSDGNEAFDLALEFIHRNKQGEAKAAFDRAEHFYQSAMKQGAGRLGVPLAILLEDFS